VISGSVEEGSVLRAILRASSRIAVGVAINLVLVVAACWLTGGITPIKLSNYLFYDVVILALIAFYIWLGNVMGRTRWSYQAGMSTGRSIRDAAKWMRAEEEQALSSSTTISLIAIAMFVLSMVASECFR